MQAARGASLTGDDTIPPGATAGPRRRIGLFAAVVVVAYAADVLTKIVAVDRLEGRPPIEVVPGVLDLTLVRNPGAAFGMATGFTVVLSAIAIVVCVVVAVVARRLRSAVWATALGLLLGGALGNLTDRLLREPGPLRGHVIDFLALPNWPVFNLADSCICVAAALVALQSFRGVGVDGQRATTELAPDADTDPEPSDTGPDHGPASEADPVSDPTSAAKRPTDRESTSDDGPGTRDDRGA